MGTFIAKKSLKIHFLVIEIFMKIHFITRKTNFRFSKSFSIFDFGHFLRQKKCPKKILKRFWENENLRKWVGYQRPIPISICMLIENRRYKLSKV